VSYLPERYDVTWRRRLQKAHEKPACQEAIASLNRLGPKFKLLNESPFASLEEGL
jgi:hypothetical protein